MTVAELGYLYKILEENNLIDKYSLDLVRKASERGLIRKDNFSELCKLVKAILRLGNQGDNKEMFLCQAFAEAIQYLGPSYDRYREVLGEAFRGEITNV